MVGHVGEEQVGCSSSRKREEAPIDVAHRRRACRPRISVYRTRTSVEPVGQLCSADRAASPRDVSVSHVSLRRSRSPKRRTVAGINYSAARSDRGLHCAERAQSLPIIVRSPDIRVLRILDSIGKCRVDCGNM